MKKTLSECIEQYSFYSGKYSDAFCNHETLTANFYLEKLFYLKEYISREFNKDIDELVNLSDIL